jgi:hypothetical protein
MLLSNRCLGVTGDSEAMCDVQPMVLELERLEAALAVA